MVAAVGEIGEETGEETGEATGEETGEKAACQPGVGTRSDSSRQYPLGARGLFYRSQSASVACLHGVNPVYAGSNG